MVRSPSIPATVASKCGSRSLRTESAELRPACTAMLTAATTSPSRSRTGAATDLRPSSSSPVDDGVALPAHAAEFRAQGVRRGDRAGGEGLQLGVLQPAFHLLVRQMGENHPAHGRHVRREARADRDRRRHDATGRHPRHVHDVVAIEDAQGRRLPYLRDELLEMRLGDLGQGVAGEVGVAEFQHARGEAEEPAVLVDVAEVGEGQQQPAGGGTGQVAGVGDLAERAGGMVGVEAADDGEAALEGLHEVWCAVCRKHRHLQ